MSTAIESVTGAAARLGRLYSHLSSSKGVERIADEPYRDDNTPAHRLDIYRPHEATRPLPVVIYIHGGAFRVMSKDTHWVAGMQFASFGTLCFNINYRLAKEAPFPAALEDVADAYTWVLSNARRYGGDPTKIVVAGESAGANLTCALTVASCFKRTEPVAKKIWELNAVPHAILPSCGILEVTRPERYINKVNWLFMDRIRTVPKSYVPHWRAGEPSIPLADPLTVLESSQSLDRAWPPTFIGCGDIDPIAEDSARLSAALTSRGVDNELKWYRRQTHAFQMMIWQKESRAFWQDSAEFMRRVFTEDST